KLALKRNIKIVVIPQEKKLEDIYITIETIARYINKNDRALEIINTMKKKLKDGLKPKSFKKVYVDLDYDFWTCGSESFISDVILKAGGVNIFNDVKLGYFKTNWEEIVRRNPDVILIVSSRNPDEFKSLISWQKVSAIKNSKVYKFSEYEREIISRPTPRIVGIVQNLRKIFQ
ncbi:MAG: ABC transporter substrate-binding protein, partial [Elusimicrobiales bacterium]